MTQSATLTAKAAELMGLAFTFEHRPPRNARRDISAFAWESACLSPYDGGNSKQTASSLLRRKIRWPTTIG